MKAVTGLSRRITWRGRSHLWRCIWHGEMYLEDHEELYNGWDLLCDMSEWQISDEIKSVNKFPMLLTCHCRMSTHGDAATFTIREVYTWQWQHPKLSSVRDDACIDSLTCVRKSSHWSICNCLASLILIATQGCIPLARATLPTPTPRNESLCINH